MVMILIHGDRSYAERSCPCGEEARQRIATGPRFSVAIRPKHRKAMTRALRVASEDT